MSYSPTNSILFAAAYAGALAGMVASGRYISGSEAADYGTLSPIAGAFAQALDTVWDDSSTPTQLEVQAIQSLVEATFEERQPITDVATLAPATWLSLAEAVVAATRAGDDYFSSIGVSSPAWPTGSGSSALTTSFVWRPGEASTAPNTFETFPELYAAVSALPEGTSVTVSVDGSLATLLVPAGGPYNLSGWTFVDWTGLYSTISFDTGAVVLPSGTTQLYFCSIGAVGTTTPITVPSGGDFNFVCFGPVFVANAGAPLVECQAGSAFAVLGSFIGFNGSSPIVTVDAGVTKGDVVFNLSSNSSIEAGTIAGAGPAVLNLSDDTTLPSSIPSTWTLLFPSSPPNFNSGLGGSGTSGTVEISIGAVAAQGSGGFLVIATMTGTCDTNCTVECVLQVDGNDIGASPTATTNVLATENFAITLGWIYFPGDTNGHNYGMRATASAGNITIANGGGGAIAWELRQ